MKTIVIATHNNSKVKDFQNILMPLSGDLFTIRTLDDLAITDQPEETAATFKENALLKAEYYGKLTKLPVITDDGGLSIDALGGEPGVKSHRWTGHESTDEELIAYTLQRMEGIDTRTATMGTTLCFYDPATNFSAFSEGSVKGHIALTPNPKWTRGYPYRAVFIVDGIGKYYDELTPAQHEQINHRVHAIKSLFEQIREYMKN